MWNKKIYIDCKCSCGVLKLTKTDDEFELSIYRSHPHLLKTSFKEKLRWIWQILVHGEIWNDYLLISKLDANKIKEFINDENY